MAEAKKTTPRTTSEQLTHVIQVVEGVKKDNLFQFGEVKKEFGGVNIRLEDHHGRIKSLEKERIERDAIEQYKREHPEVAAKIFETGQDAYNESSGTTTINKQLLNALKILGLVIAALGVALIGTKWKP